MAAVLMEQVRLVRRLLAVAGFLSAERARSPERCVNCARYNIRDYKCTISGLQICNSADTPTKLAYYS